MKKKLGEQETEVPLKYLPFGAFLLFPFVLAWTPFTVPGIIALLGMCAQCFSFRRRDCRPGVPDAFCWGRVIPDGWRGTQGVLPDCFGCWVLQAVVLYCISAWVSAFSFLFPELRSLWWYGMGHGCKDMGIWNIRCSEGVVLHHDDGFTCAFSLGLSGHLIAATEYSY
ncbi:hypothetical protein HDV62DRAFT_359572 [Trichoderma sp. SZMC 28011]